MHSAQSFFREQRENNRHWQLLLGVISVIILTAISACHLHSSQEPSSLSPQTSGTGEHFYYFNRISPRGDYIAYVDYCEGKNTLTVEQLDSRVKHTLDLGSPQEHAVEAIEWAHDGQHIAIATSKNYISRIYTPDISVASLGKSRTELTGIISSVKWSPHDRRLAVLGVEHPHKALGATSAGVRQIGHIDGTIDEQRVGILSLEDSSQRIEFISPADTFSYSMAWTPNGRGIVTTSAPGDGDSHWWSATINYLDIIQHTNTVLTRPQYQAQFPVVSPDSTQVAFIGGLMSDAVSAGGDIYVLPLTGGKPHNITPQATSTYTYIQWNQRGIYANAATGLHQQLVRITHPGTPEHKSTVVWHDNSTDGRIRVDQMGTHFTSIRNSFTQPPTILAGTFDHPICMTPGKRKESAIEAHEIHWKNENLSLDGWLLAPRHMSAGKHPLLVDVHGGPAARQYISYVNMEHPSLHAAVLARQYFIFLPNPRGSFGHGETFVQANRHDFGGGDFRDIVSGVQQVESQFPIDQHKRAITGVSYGGFMAMWAAATSTSFQAAIAGAGPSDWYSYYGINGIHDWLKYYFGTDPYHDRKNYLAQSPISYVHLAHTPTLLWVGEHDIECPPSQSLEFYTALRDFHVPTELYIYPDEGHGLRLEKNIKDSVQQSVRWLDTYLK